MLLNHIGIFNKSKEEAVRFYRDFLEFEITKESVVPGDLTRQLFSVSKDTRMLVFGKNGIKIEVFICPECRQPSPDFNHMGLLLDNFQELVDKAGKAGVEVIIGRTSEKTVYFIKDFSGNLIEIKQK